MESLAAVVTAILLGVLTLGAAALVVTVRPARSVVGRVLGGVVGVTAVLCGAWLAHITVTFAGDRARGLHGGGV